MKLVAITDGAIDDDRLAALCEVEGVAVQVRAKHASGRAVAALAARVAAIARPRGARVWVNDRLDVARAIGADGVHLPEHGFDVASARAIWRGAIGVSRHGALEEEGADLVQLGPIWTTPGKGAPRGVEALTQARARVRGALVAVGGIETPGQAWATAAAGADGVAMIRALIAAGDPAGLARDLVAAVADGQRAFIASQGAP